MMTDRASKRLLAGQAWDDYCESVRRAGHMVDAFGDEANELDRAEWYRFMTRLMRNGFERFMENCEPDRPRLRDTPWRQGINFQSPDQDHLLAEFVDGRHAYRISGNRGTLPYFVMASWTSKQPHDIGEHDWAERGTAALEEFDPAMLRTTSFLKSDAIDFDAQGNFEVIVSREPPASGTRNWLRISPDCVGVLVRTLYHCREDTIAPTMRIERLDEVSPRPIRAAEMSDGLAKAAQMVLGYAELVRSWWQENLSSRPNRIRFSREVYLSNGGVPDRHHGFGTWEKRADEALVLHFTPTICEYWIFQLCNIWQENLDCYEDGQGYVSKHRAIMEVDGSVRIVIADENPGIGGNWISSFGHVHGGMSLRLINTAGEPPAISVYRLAYADIKRDGYACLKHSTPIVSGEVAD